MNKLNETQESELIKLYESGIGSTSLSKIFNLADTNILALLRRNKIPIRYFNRNRKHHFNQSAFESITTTEQAYWLGFITADGSVNTYSLRVELHCRDKVHLEKFIKFMSSDIKVKDTQKECCSVCFNSKPFIKSLEKYGIVKNKTSCTYTPNIPEHLLVDYYRGVFDGDGWFAKRTVKWKDGTSERRTVELGFSSGCELFIKEIHKWFCDKLNRQCGHLIYRKRKNQSVYQLTFGGNKLLPAMINLLYQDATIYLDRKKSEANETSERIKNNKRKSRTKKKDIKPPFCY